MKKSFLILLLSFLAISSFAQVPKKTMDYDPYNGPADNVWLVVSNNGNGSYRTQGKNLSKTRVDSLVNALGGKVNTQRFLDSLAAVRSALAAAILSGGGSGSQGPAGPAGATGATGATGPAGANGTSAYVYIAYADDASGTGFTNTFNSSKDYIAIRSTTTAIPSPLASDFIGLWKNYKGAPGAGGNGFSGVSSFNSRTGAVIPSPGDYGITDITGLSTALGGKADASSLTAHTSNTANPHNVTAAQVGLGNANNTSDANKPISTATQSALNLKANIANPTFTGVAKIDTDTLATKAYARSLANAGSSINAVQASSLGYFIVDATTYGNGTTSASAYIQAKLDSAAKVWGTVYFRVGTYRINQMLNWNPHVSLIGENIAGVVLKAQTGFTGTLLGDTSNKSIIQEGFYFPYAEVKNLQFDGNNTATSCADLQYIWNFGNWSNLQFRNCTGIALNLKGVLIGELNNCLWHHVGSCVYGFTGPDANFPALPSNLIEFRNCNFYYWTDWAIRWTAAAALELWYCDFELGGLYKNVNTGGVLWENGTPNGEGLGLLVYGSWFERNNGIGIKIVNGSSHTSHRIQDVMMQFSGGQAYGVWMQASNGAKQSLVIDHSQIQSETNTADVFITGADASLLVTNKSRIGVLSTQTGATSSVFESAVTTHSEVSGTYRDWETLWTSSGGPTDLTPPTVTSVAIADAAKSDVVLTYSEPLLTSSVPATTDFSFDLSKTATNVAIAGSKVTVTVNAPYAMGETPHITYVAGTNKIKDLNGNPANNLTNRSITNNIGNVFPETGLSAYYDFIETDGDFIDKSGNAKDLVRTNGVTKGTGKIDGAGIFATVNDKLTGAGTGFGGTTGWTWAGWAKMTHGSGNQMIFYKAAPGAFEYDCYYQAGNYIFEFRDAGGAVHVATAPFLPNDADWHYVVFRWDGTNLQCFLDNVGGTPVACTSMASGTAPFTLGNASGGLYGISQSGGLSAVGVWSIGLTNAQIAYLYNSGAGRPKP